jgi:ParB/RepB/Spo0J family partition protein
MKSAIDVRMIRLHDIEESPTNPRKHFGDLAELAASIAEKGVLQPVLARPHPTVGDGCVQLVAGARRFRAAGLAKLEAIPVIVREMTDLEVLEVQVIENNQRSDVHPLEEADGFQQLATKHGRTAEQIAAKIGRSTAYVYARMKLAELAPEVRQAFAEGKIGGAVALVLARMPHAGLQAKALEELLGYHYEAGDGPSAAEARELVRQRFMLRIADAPFDTTDKDLHPGAPACSVCPKRTGNQGELFADMGGEDLCTDPECFGEKRDIGWRLKCEAAKANGQQVLDEKQAKKAFGYGGRLNYDSDFVDLAEEEWDHESGKRKTWRKLLGRALKDMPTILARDPDGGVHELVRKTDAAKAVNPRMKEGEGPDLGPDQEAAKAEQAKARQKAAAESEGKRRALAELVEAVERVEVASPEVWLALVLGVLGEIWEEHRKEVARRRGLLEEGERAADALENEAKKMDERQLQGLLVELIAVRGSAYRDFDPFESLCEAYEVDHKQHVKDAAAELKAKAKAKEKGKKGRAA